MAVSMWCVAGEVRWRQALLCREGEQASLRAGAGREGSDEPPRMCCVVVRRVVCRHGECRRHGRRVALRRPVHNPTQPQTGPSTSR